MRAGLDGFQGGHYRLRLFHQPNCRGVQVFELKTDGWSWMWGGGGEVWLTPIIGFWGEFSWVKLVGKATGGGEGSLNDSVTSVVGGIRLSLGRN